MNSQQHVLLGGLKCTRRLHLNGKGAAADELSTACFVGRAEMYTKASSKRKGCSSG